MKATNEPGVDFHARIELPGVSRSGEHVPAAVIWLDPAEKASEISPPPPGRFTLLQKNRVFSPHLLVVPVGSVVSFPNADPFFHNVFSYFNGKRFDLGLYEAGATKNVTFSREGVSYIFCNIHPQMSAVVIALSTPLYAATDTSARATIRNVPPGSYVLHVWEEGLSQADLDRLTRRIELAANATNSIIIGPPAGARPAPQHLNKFGQPYERPPNSPY